VLNKMVNENKAIGIHSLCPLPRHTTTIMEARSPISGPVTSMVHVPAIRPITRCTFQGCFRINFCSSGRIFSKKGIAMKKFCTRSRSLLKIFKRGVFENKNAFAKKKYPGRTLLIPVKAPVPVEDFSRFMCDRNRENYFSNAITIAQNNFQTR
ncbi:hypothetical protein, partial [Methanoregula sp.]|uniref:hypothetical protein n=1 Tax=Methanoregula sp. TaxID=2052170 RepID=UPI000CC8F71F